MNIDFNVLKNILINLSLGAVLWEVVCKPVISGRINFFYSGKLERKKLEYSQELEQLKSALLKEVQISLEEMKLENSKQIEEYKRTIDHVLKTQEMLADAKLKIQINASNLMFDKELSIYTEVVETIYRCRNLARECLELLKIERIDSPRIRDNVSDFPQYASHLVENLYKYKIFFPEFIFRKLHKLKTDVQEYSILLNEITRSIEVEDAPVNIEIRKYMTDPPLSEEWHREQQRKHDLAKRLAEVIYKYGESELSDAEVSLLQDPQVKKMVDSFILPMIAKSKSYTHIIIANWYLKNQNHEIFRQGKLRMSTNI